MSNEQVFYDSVLEREATSYAEQEILNSDDRIFSLILSNKETGKKVFFAVNVSDKPVEITVPFSGENLRTQTKVEDTLSLNAYDYVWVKG